MKVLTLQCERQHVFEGWFASEEEFAGQRERGLLECPLCGATRVHKLPSAPRLNLGAPRHEEVASAPAPDKPVALTGDNELSTLQAAWLQMARRVLATTEDVGERFPEEVRKMHYGEIEERGIRGRASREQTEALLDEGIPVLPLPLPAGLDGPVH